MGENSFWEEAAAGGYVLMLEHDPFNECCMLEKTEKGIKVGKTFRLGEL